jgi:transketolase
MAVGISLALKKRNNFESRVFVVMGDGECNEGSVWEAVMLAAHHNLDNLVAIVDKNNWQAMGKTDDVIKVKDWRTVFGSFGWAAYKGDGHNFSEIETGLESMEKPTVFIAETVKGKGVSFMENHLLYHYKNVDDETYQKAMEELCQN